MIYVISLAVFAGIIFLLVATLLAVEGKVVRKGDCKIVINNNEDKPISVSGGTTLLSSLLGSGILLPSACGGGGSCGTCKCVVEQGNRGVLPTELPHLSRKERQENVRLACQLKVKEDLKIRIPEQIFSIKKFHGVVSSNQNVATFIKELDVKLDAGESFDFHAGAYMQIDIPEYEAAFKDFHIGQRFKKAWDRFNLWGLRAKTEEPVFRAYSLANPPGEKDPVKFTIRIATPPPGKEIPPGVGSSYVFHLDEGDRVTLSGPYGEFAVKPTQREMCFIGGGAGMAPLRSQIREQLLYQKTQRTMTFWYGARSKAEMFYDEEFKELESNHKNFSYFVSLSDPQPEDGWTGMTGYVHNVLYDQYLAKHDDPTEIEYYLCGPPPMLDAIIRMLDGLGVEPNMIAYDKF